MARARRLIGTDLAANIRRLWSAELISLVIAVVTSLLLARHLGPRSYGTLAVLTASGGLVFTFLDPRAAEAVTRFFPSYSKGGRQSAARALVRFSYTADACLAVAGAVVLTGVGLVLQRAVDVPPGSLLLVATSAALTAPMATSRAVLATLGLFKTTARVQILSTIERTALLLAGIALDAGVVGILAVLLAGTAVEAVALAVVARRALSRANPGTLRSARFRELAPERGAIRHYLVFAGLSTLVGSLVKFADTVLVGLIAGPVAASYYRLGASFAVPIASISLPLQSVTYNRLVHQRSTDDEAGFAKTLRHSRYLALPISALLLCSLPLLPFAVRLLAGDPYAPAGQVAQVLVAGGAISLLGFWLRPAFLARGKERPFFWVSLTVGLISVPALVAGALIAEAMGVAVMRVATVALLGNLLLYARYRSWEKSRGGT